MVPPEWIATVVGALLCLVISWFLAVVSRSQGVRFGKAGPAIGITGALVLAGMAVVGPLRVSESKEVVSMESYTNEGYPIFSKGSLRHRQILSVFARTIQEVGSRPSENHFPFEHPDGKLEWVTKEKYTELKTKQVAKDNK